MLHYTVSPQPESHLWHITLSFEHNSDVPQTLKLANWVAGSYMIRDFARHIVRIQAACGGEAVKLVQTAKNEWHTPPKRGRYQIRYTVYADDLSVRASLLDTERGFIDGACLFLYLPERRGETCEVRFEGLPENWRIETALRQPENAAPNVFQAASYAELTDCPIEMGANIETLRFTACGIPHRIALSGHRADFDRTRLLNDCQAICSYELSLFPRPAPFSEYLFLLHVGDGIYGGLEHTSSTALHADRNALPRHGMREADTAYTQLLGLISHEYFHAWNVKSIKPQAFCPYDLDKEAYTEQLWAFEGITSYYDDLALVRSRTITPEAYLNLLAQNITRVHRNAGRKQQTLAESSFAAWHKYYKQDENSPNAITSYYQKGALAALCLDLLIREKSSGTTSLDTVMHQLYQDWLDTQRGIPEQQWQARAQEITGLDLHDFFQAALYSTEDLPLSGCLKTAGVELQWQPAARTDTGRLVSAFPDNTPAPDSGCRFKQQDGRALISHIANGGAAERAGLKAGDIIIAVNRFACTDFAAQAETRAGDRHTLHYFRHGVLHETKLTIQPAAADTAYLKIADTGRLARWLGI